MSKCNICLTDYVLCIYCVNCRIWVCDPCYLYALENKLCGKMFETGCFYCSIFCILTRQNENPDFLQDSITYHFNKIEPRYICSPSYELFVKSQEIAYNQCITPQIKKILNNVIQVIDLCNIICEFYN